MSTLVQITHVREVQVIRRERIFSSDDLHDLIHFLRDCRATGTLFIDLNQGGIGTIRFREETHVYPSDMPGR